MRSTFIRVVTVLFLALPVLGLAGSFAAQYGLGWQPCPLCILQRVALLLAVIAVLFFRWIPRTVLFSVATSAAFGASVAAYQSWHILNPSGAQECGGQIGYYLWMATSDFPWLSPLLSAGGDCLDASYSFAGVPLATVSFALFAIIYMLAWIRVAYTQPPMAGAIQRVAKAPRLAQNGAPALKIAASKPANVQS